MLTAPDWAELDTIWRNPLPFILWPICGKSLLGYWLDEAMIKNVATVYIRTEDRPHLVRAWLEQGDYWSRKIEVVSSSFSLPVDAVFSMDTFPEMSALSPVENGAQMLERWFLLHEPALQRRERATLTIDREVSPGVWAAPGSRIDPGAKLIAPCWIGPQSRVSAGCVVGPHAYVGKRAVLDEDVEVTDAVVCDDTFVGRHTRLSMAAAQGGLLLNWARGVAVRIAEDFILADLSRHPGRPNIFERLFAICLRLLAWPAARVWNLSLDPIVREVSAPSGEGFSLQTWPRGPLIVRREHWLAAVATGRMRLLGVLPREKDDWDALPVEMRALFQQAPLGVLSLADLFDCHDPREPDEWMHAAYQIGAPDAAGFRRLRRSAFAVALKQPLAS